jgi:hypothetical protein
MRSPVTAVTPSEVPSIDLQTLASQAHVHRNTISRALGSKGLQRFIRAASDVSGDLSRAVFWYRNESLAPFD